MRRPRQAEAVAGAQGAIDQATLDLLSAPHLAALQGSGAIAQGDAAQAVGEKGVGVRGNNYAPIDTGTHFYIGTGDAAIKSQALRKVYLGRVWRQANAVSLLAGADHRDAVRLAAVNTALMTERTDDRDGSARPGKGLITDAMTRRHRLSAIAVLDADRRLVLLGGPGSGKSTFVNFVAQAMAGELLGAEAESPEPNLATLTVGPNSGVWCPQGSRSGASNQANQPGRSAWRWCVGSFLHAGQTSAGTASSTQPHSDGLMLSGPVVDRLPIADWRALSTPRDRPRTTTASAVWSIARFAAVNLAGECLFGSGSRRSAHEVEGQLRRLQSMSRALSSMRLAQPAHQCITTRDSAPARSSRLQGLRSRSQCSGTSRSAASSSAE